MTTEELLTGLRHHCDTGAGVELDTSELEALLDHIDQTERDRDQREQQLRQIASMIRDMAAANSPDLEKLYRAAYVERRDDVARRALEDE